MFYRSVFPEHVVCALLGPSRDSQQECVRPSYSIQHLPSSHHRLEHLMRKWHLPSSSNSPKKSGLVATESSHHLYVFGTVKYLDDNDICMCVRARLLKWGVFLKIVQMQEKTVHLST